MYLTKRFCRAGVILLGLFFLFSLNYAEDWQSIDRAIYTVSNAYEKGKSRELMGSYKQAVEAYVYTLQTADSLLQNKALKKEQVLDVLPYTIAAAYRLAITNEKMINGRMVYIYEQMERYKTADEQISQTLTVVSNLRIDQNMDIPVQYYGHLYYARAINALGISYSLANGILWKKYLVYMPSDIVMIMDNARKDLEHYLYVNNVASSADVTAAVDKLSESIGSNSNLEMTMKLSYYLNDKPELQKALNDRFQKSVLVFLDRYRNSKILFAKVSDLKTYEEFEQSPDSRQFIAEIRTLLELLKSY